MILILPLLALTGLAGAVPALPTGYRNASSGSKVPSRLAPSTVATPTPVSVSVSSTGSRSPSRTSSSHAAVITPSMGLVGNELKQAAFGSSSGAVLFSSSGPWLTIPCNAPGLTDDRSPASDRWKTADASEAWDQAMAGFNKDLKDPDITQLTFDAWLWNAFHYNDFPNCWDFLSDNCGTVQCGAQGIMPAGYLMLNSISGLNQVVKSAYYSLQSSQNFVQNKMTDFVKTFTSLPDQTSEEVLKFILDSLSFGIGIGSAFTWNVFIKEAALFAEDTYRGAWKDVFNGAIAYGINMGKDSLGSSDPQVAIADVLTNYQDAFFNATVSNLSGFLKTTLGAQNETTQVALTNMAQNGSMYKFLSLQDSLTDLQQSTLQLFWGRLLTVVWPLSPNKMNPFILRVDRKDYKCGDPVQTLSGEQMMNDGFNLGKWMTPDTAKQTQWCDSSGNTWFLLNAVTPQKCQTANPNDCLLGQQYVFGTLTGGDSGTLDGNNWGGITLQDMITSSYGGFLANGGKNGYTMADSSSLVINQDWSAVSDGGLPMIGGIQTPGFFNFTICLNAAEAAGNILEGKAPVCANVPDSTGVSPSVNQNGYTPGWCGVHLSQYEKSTGSANPLAEYQLAITIFDGAGQPIAYATKQPVDPAIIVPSKLPFNLIVSDNGADDTVCFWYSDQYWCSNDQAHHCNFGKYDGDTKAREGNCGFTCNNPSSSPPASATQQVPAGALTAYLGTGAAAATAVAPPKSYATGSCGLHIRQYQKTETANDLNPGPDYALELTLYDAKKTLLAYMDKTDAPTGQWLNIQGPLPWILQASTEAVDGDPVDLRYAAQSWTTKSSQCSQGGWNKGLRDIDCDFSC